MVGLVSLLPLLTVTGAGAQAPTLPALQVVVLVDESGGLSDADVAKEKEAAQTIVAGVLASGSVVSVVGFGSSNGPGQSAAHVVCPPTVLDGPQQRGLLATCIGGLHKRTPAEGDGTDHASALQQALSFVTSGGPEKKVVFLLTDGKLDVSDSPVWGDTANRRNAAAAAKAREVLADLDRAGAQVWPIGFGDVDQVALAGFAKGKSCSPAAPDPQTRVTSSSDQLSAAVMDAFSSASCVKYPQTVTGHLPPGGSSDLTIDIHVLANDATIVAYKGDPRVRVEYWAPNADKPAPMAGASHFEFAGQTTKTETLRITDPEPGQWRIHASSAADVPAQDVAITAYYSAAVTAYLTVSPPQPTAGQTVDIDMQARARGRAVTDPAVLQGLSFVTTLTGSGFPPQQVTLSDPDQDGTFTGQLKVPDGASGDLTFTGHVTGIGIDGDTRVLSTKVQEVPAAVKAQILFDANRATVMPGETVSGTISVTNDSGQPTRLRLMVTDPSPGTILTVNPAVVRAAPGLSTTKFMLHFAEDNAIGASAATLRLVYDEDPATVVAERLFATNVAPEPAIFENLFWLLALTVLMVGAVLLITKLRARNQAGRGLAVAIPDERRMVGPSETVGGPVTEVSFKTFGGPAVNGSFPKPPAGPSAGSYGNPFASSGAGAPESSAQPAPADPFASSYEGPFEAPVTVAAYLDTDDEAVARQVFAALDELARAVGYETPTERELRRGSWWRRAVARLGKGVTSNEVTSRLIKVERAIELRQIENVQADVDLKLAAAISQLMTSLAEVPQACVILGSLLLIKYQDGQGPVIVTRTLSQQEIRALERFPEIQAKPREVLSALSTVVATLEIAEVSDR